MFVGQGSTTERPAALAPLTRAHALVLLGALLLCPSCAGLEGTAHTQALPWRGVVRDADGPVAGAIVRLQTTEVATTTAADGSFSLPGTRNAEPLGITAWAPGYYIGGGASFAPGARDIVVTLTRHGSRDNPDYRWVSGFSSEGKEGNCQNCHASTDRRDSVLPFDEWQRDAHGQSGRNQRFLSMYRGADLRGNVSPPTRRGYSRDYGSFPLRPEPSKPYFGPGYKLDFPTQTGNCAACHMPSAAISAPYGTDPALGSEGVTCDFCHKVWDVRLDPATGLPFPNNPGVLSFVFRRPEGKHQFFAGPLDDVAPGEDTCSPLQKRSQFCAPCHSAAFWDTRIYNSFGEWLESPYSKRENGRSCQDCHMPACLTDHFARLDKGGRRRDPSTIFSHLMPGASNQELLRNAVTMSVSGGRRGGRISIEVTLTNDKTGHHVPTDSPLRQMILLLEASDDRGQPLSLLDGPTVPAWGGVGDPGRGYYGGRPGKAYAKVLMELWTETAPTGAYWNHTRVASDNRIPALASDTSSYAFAAPAAGGAVVSVRLLYRRAFKALMDQKGWNSPDILMAQQELTFE